jgi:hypothetical protein
VTGVSFRPSRLIIPLPLLCLVIDEFLDVGLCELDLGEDLVSRRRPSQRCGVSVRLGVKCKCTCGLRSNQATTSGVVCVDSVPSTTWMSVSECCLTALRRKARKSAPSRVGLHAEHLAGADVQRGEQVRCAVPDVVLSAFLGDVELDREHRLGAVQRLYPGLHHRSSARRRRRVARDRGTWTQSNPNHATLVGPKEAADSTVHQSGKWRNRSRP